MKVDVPGDGLCPFLTCPIWEPHAHPICEVCEAVRYSNFYCPRCKEVRASDPNPTVGLSAEESRALYDQFIDLMRNLYGSTS